MNIKRVAFTESVLNIIRVHTQGNEQLYQGYCSQIAQKVGIEIPKKEFDVDSSDNALSFAGIPLTFIRDWNEGEAYIMTNAEALAIDNNTQVYPVWIALTGKS